MRQIGDLTEVVHLAISKQQIPLMLEKYLQHPRPILWGDKYVRKPNESPKEALSRSYRALLAYREQLYKEYAHRSIPFEVHRI